MTEYLLQTIPNGIEEITAAAGLLGILLFLLFGYTKPKVKWTIVFLLLFTVSWRMILSRSQEMSSRYVSGLIIPYILLALYSFHQLPQKRFRQTVRWCMAIIMAVVLLNYIKKDLKRNERDLNYYAIAEIARKSNADRKAEMFFVPQKDFERISFLSRTDNIQTDQKDYLPCKNNNFEKLYFPSVIDVDFDNSIFPDDTWKQVCSFITGKDSNKKINLFHSDPSVHLEIDPTLASIDTTTSILRNGTIEAIDPEEESQKKLSAHVSYAKSLFQYEGTFGTPQNAYFYVLPRTEKKNMTLGIESANPIDGQNSVSIRSDDGPAYLFFSQRFRKGRYSYSFLIQGKRGTMVQAVFSTFFDRRWHITPVCLFTIPDSRTFRISGSFDFDGLKDTDYFRVGVEVQNGETLLDDFVLKRKEAKPEIDDHGLTAEAAGTKNKPEVENSSEGHAAITIGTESGDAPVISGMPSTAVLKAWNAEHDVHVYQDAKRLLWLIGKTIGRTPEVICHFYTDEPERLPENRVQYGFENRGFKVPADKRAANELESIDGYRVFVREIPEDYYVTDIVVGIITDDQNTWRESFRNE